MADDRSLVVRFAADIEDLRSGVASVAGEIESSLGRGLEKAGRAGKESGAAVKAGFKDAGDGLRVVGALLGQQSAQIVQVGSQLATFSGELGSAFKSGAARVTLIGAAVVGVGAGVASLVNNWDLVKAKTASYWQSLKAAAQGALAYVDDRVADLSDALGGSGEKARANAAALRASADAARKLAEEAERAAQRIQAIKALNADAATALGDFIKRSAALINQLKVFGGSVELAEQRVAGLKTLLAALASSGDPKYVDDIERYRKELEQAESTLRVLKGIEDDRKAVSSPTIDARLITEAGAALERYREESQALANVQSALGPSLAGLEAELQLLESTMLSLAASGSPNFAAELEKLGEQHRALTEQLAKEKFKIELDEEAFARTTEGIEATRRQVADLQAWLGTLSDEGASLADALGLSEEGIRTLTERQEQVRAQFVAWFDDLRLTQEDFLNLTRQTVDTFASQLGDVVARVIVYGDDIRESFAGLGKQIAASIISSLVQIGVQALIWFLFGQTILKKKAAAEIGTATSVAAAWAAAHSIKELGLKGIALAPVFSALAIGVTAGGAKAGYAAGAGVGGSNVDSGGDLSAPTATAASGALITGPTHMLLGERDSEIVITGTRYESILRSLENAGQYQAPASLSRSYYDSLLDAGAGQRPIVFNTYLDGRQVAQVVAENWQSVMNRQGIKGR